jgi:hypothetical protein
LTIVVSPKPPFPLEVVVTDAGTKAALLVLRTSPADQPIAPHTIVGQVALATHGPAWSTFRPNRAFIDRLHRYLRGEAKARPPGLAKARVQPGEYVYVIDERAPDPSGDVEPHDIVGAYHSNSDGTARPATFKYNPNHRLVLGDGTLSGYLTDPDLHAALLEPSS